MILREEFEVAAPGFAVFPGELLARRFPKDWGILIVQVGVFGVPYITALIEVLLAASPDAERLDGPPELRSGDVGR